MEHISMIFDHENKKPLYLQLHDYLATEISAGRIREGERLPGKRTAASMLGVSQITVDGAYQLLASEGYISSKPRSGFVVCRLESLEPPPVYDEPVVYRSRSSSAELSLLTD